MIEVLEWVKESSKETRCAHLDLSEDCIERGGNSTVHRGILAQYLSTDMPNKIDLCHKCGNGKCSNPKHLYWGTRKENIQDSIELGTRPNPWESLVLKYGDEGARKLRSRVCDMRKAGSGNKGKPKSEEHKRKLSEATRAYYENRINN